MRHISNVVGPVVADGIRKAGPIKLKPIMRRALHMGDELHSRNTAASLLFSQALLPYLMRITGYGSDAIDETIKVLTQDSYFFLRLSMAASKSTADAAHGVSGSSLVTAMAFNCKRFGIRVSGLGDRWFEGPLPRLEANLFEGYTSDDITWMGGESTISETVGLGGFAQAAAFPLQRYQGGSPQKMIDSNLSLYEITYGENTEFRIPFFEYRGTPTGIDIFKVISSGVTPAMDIGIPGRDGGQIGAGKAIASRDCFDAAVKAYKRQYVDY
jgi:hypothetical protein